MKMVKRWYYLLRFLFKYKEYNISVFNGKDSISDGYHTMEEVYYQRMLYNAAFVNLFAKKHPDKICKSSRHSSGEVCFGGGWFIVVIELPTGQISQHYEMTYWNLFKCQSRYSAFPYDGHDSNLANDRLFDFIIQM